MENKKDELVSAAELAKRLNVSAPYISSKKEFLKNAKCMYGKKFYYRKSSLALGKNPDNPHETTQKASQKDKSKSNDKWDVYTGDNAKKKINEVLEDLKPKQKKQVPQKKDNVPRGTIEDKELILQLKEENNRLKKENEQLKKINNIETIDDIQSQIKRLQSEILIAVSDSSTTYDKAMLDGLKTKAAILKEFELAIHQGIKNKTLQENTYTYEDIEVVVNQTVSIFRNALLNLGNNYAVNLEGMTKKQIKDFVTEDINSILEDFEKLKEKFKE